MTGRGAGGALGAALLAAIVLAACASPPARIENRAPVSVTRNTPVPAGAPTSAPLAIGSPPTTGRTGEEGGAVATPLPSQAPALTGPGATAPQSLDVVRPAKPPNAPPAASVVFSAPVEGRFSDAGPPIDTPAFAPGRLAYTTEDELRTALRSVASRPSPLGLPPTAIEVLSLGASTAGRAIEAIAFTRPPSALASDGAARRPVLIVVGGLQGDEPAPAEALLVVARALADGRHERVLERLDVVLVPRAHPDAAATAAREPAGDVDLDTDHVRLRSPEARALAALLGRLEPAVVVELREYPVVALYEAKTGGVQRADVQLQVAATANAEPLVGKAAEEWLREPVARALGQSGFTTDWLHGVSADPADRIVAMGGVESGRLRNAAALRQAAAVVIATRGGGLQRSHLARRVRAQVAAMEAVLGAAAVRAADVAKLQDFVGRETTGRACRRTVTLEAAQTPSEYALAVLDAETGAEKRATVAWRSSLELRPVRSRPRPCGYWLDAREVAVVETLRALGVAVRSLDEPGDVRGETYREVGPDASQGGPWPKLRVQTQAALLDLPAGGFYVPLDQPLANLAVAALEPEAPGSFSAGRALTSLQSLARVVEPPSMRMSDPR